MIYLPNCMTAMPLCQITLISLELFVDSDTDNGDRNNQKLII